MPTKLSFLISFLQNPYCVVIINIFFENKVGPRNGAQADRENIERLLTRAAGFNSVHVYCDQRRNDTLEIMEKISNSPEMGKFNVSYTGVANFFQEKPFTLPHKNVKT